MGRCVDKKWLWFALIVIMSLGIIVDYTFSHNIDPLGGDAGREYQVMLKMLEEQTWKIQHN